MKLEIELDDKTLACFLFSLTMTLYFNLLFLLDEDDDKTLGLSPPTPKASSFLKVENTSTTRMIRAYSQMSFNPKNKIPLNPVHKFLIKEGLFEKKQFNTLQIPEFSSNPPSMMDTLNFSSNSPTFKDKLHKSCNNLQSISEQSHEEFLQTYVNSRIDFLKQPTQVWEHVLLILLGVGTLFSLLDLSARIERSSKLDFIYCITIGWIACMSTGLGSFVYLIIPFSSTLRGVGSAMASAAMIALALPAFLTSPNVYDFFSLIFGGLGAWGFVFLLDKRLQQSNFRNQDNLRMCLSTILVFSLDACVEGCLLGLSDNVSIGFITNLVLHNIPEGLLVSFLFKSCEVPTHRIFLFCILTSIGQPIFACLIFKLSLNHSLHQYYSLHHVIESVTNGSIMFIALFDMIPKAVESIGIGSTISAMGTTLVILLILDPPI